MIRLLHFFLLATPSRFAIAEATTELVCPRRASIDQGTRLIGQDPVRSFTEISGAAFSSTQVAPQTGDPILYVITDGFNNDNETVGRGRIGVFDSGTGRRLLTLVLSVQAGLNYDWEALAFGSCGNVEGDCIYVGDVGDNVASATSGRRNDRTENPNQPFRPYRIIKIKEPDFRDIPSFGTGAVESTTRPDTQVWILPFDYKDDSSPTDFSDCEALILDHTGWGEGCSIGDLYLITKWGPDHPERNRLFHIPVDAWQNGDSSTGITYYPAYSPQAVGDYTSEGSVFTQNQWTGADMALNGTVISLSTPHQSFLFLRCPGESVAQALTGTAEACSNFNHPIPGGVETSAWTPSASRLLVIKEGRKPRMQWSNIAYDGEGDGDDRVCPEFTETTVTSGLTFPPEAEDTTVLETADNATSAETPPPTEEMTLILEDLDDTTMENATTIIGNATDPSEIILDLDSVGNNGNPDEAFPLGLCQGDCDEDDDCAGDLICFSREEDEPVPGCTTPDGYAPGDDFCISLQSAVDAGATVDSVTPAEVVDFFS